MPEIDSIWMSLVIFLPSVFALILLLFPKGYDEAMRWWALFGTALTLGLSISMLISFKNDVIDLHGAILTPEKKYQISLPGRAELADNAIVSGDPARSKDWLARYPWVERFHIDYYLGLDGISMPLVLLTSTLCFLAMIASWKITRFVRGYLFLFLLLETGMIGTFLALDFFLFYVFWELMLLPMYFLIGIWGGPRREYAALKFFLYTLFGSVLILIALLAFYFTNVRDFASTDLIRREAERMKGQTPGMSIEQARDRLEIHTFDLVVLQRLGKAALQRLRGEAVTAPAVEEARRALAHAEATHAPEGELAAARESLKQAEARLAATLKQAFFTPAFQYTIFILLFVGFAIKIPLFPFHTWLPDAHVEAPTAVSMLLAGVLLKTGAYGLLRIAVPICPWAAHQLTWYIALLAVIGIVYGALVAMAQTDLKKLVAYSSVSHMGYVVLGIAVWSSASDVQYWSQGLTGAVFLMVAHGITSAALFFLVGVVYDRANHRNLDNFRGLYEPMPLFGGISALIFFAAMGLPGLCGFFGEFLIFLAAWNFDRTFAVLAAFTVVLTAAYFLWTLQRLFMGHNPIHKNYADITVRELACVLPLAILAVVLGVAPGLLVNWTEPSLTGLAETLAAPKR